jgi:glucuronate isomerase
MTGLDPDRLLPAERRTRHIARGLYERVRRAPIISPHGHVPAETIAADRPFTDPAQLLVATDHYVTRLLHADGVPLDDLLGNRSEGGSRAVWRLLADRWHLFAGTASGYWIDDALMTQFGVDVPLTSASADEIYDVIAERLGQDDFRPRRLFERFGIDLLATTDDPLDDLASHAAIAASDLPGRVVPTFRPDKYLDPESPTFAADIARLVAQTEQPATFTGYRRALVERRQHFVRHGAISADHGVVEPTTLELDAGDAERLLQRALAGQIDPSEARAFRAHMLVESATMSVDDGLVMTLHAGVHRNHSAATHARFGPDTGHDIPVPISWVAGLRPLLERTGLAPGFHLLLFTVDESTWSRELAPLAGFYPSVYVGAPWWFLDAPDAIARFRAAVTETAGFYRGSGFVDDTRAFLSIPSRHDAARRVDAGFLARLVVEGRLSPERAESIADDLVDAIPRRAFKIPTEGDPR